MSLANSASAVPHVSSQPPTNFVYLVVQHESPMGLLECFDQLHVDVRFDLPHHRRQRATLVAISASFPSFALSLTESSTVATYLAAFISALNRFVPSTDPVALHDSAHSMPYKIRDCRKRWYESNGWDSADNRRG